MAEENIAIRLKFLIENLELTSSQFADKCDIARPTLSQLLSGRNKKISNLIIEQIHNAYPTLSVMWLLFGEGDMWSSHCDGNSIKSQDPILRDQSVTEATSEAIHSSNGNMADKANSSLDNMQNSLKNAPVESDFITNDKDCSKYSKENGVNSIENTSVNSNNENVNCICNSMDILTQLEKTKVKPRKVVQITVYYDDSTFQTFYPNK